MKEKILFLLPSFRKGGEAKNTLNILNTLDSERFDLTLLICSKGNDDLNKLLIANVKLIEFRSYPTASRTILAVLRIIWTLRPDITFTSFIDLNYIVGIYKLISFRKITSILRFNTLPSNKLSSNSVLKKSRRRMQLSIKSADKIIAQTPEMRNDILKHFPNTKGKAEVILNAINQEQVAELADEYIPYEEHDGTTLVAVGSLWEVKGFDYLIKAIAKLVYEHQETVRLFIVGENMHLDGGYDKYLKGLINDLGLEKYVYLEGYTSNPYPYMKHADIFVLPSLKEGFPNVVLEALSLKVPCVVTDCIDFTEIIVPESNGYIVSKANVEALADGILQVKDINFKMQELKMFDYNRWFTTLAQ